MWLSIPTGGVSSSVSGDSRKGEHCLFNCLFEDLYAHIVEKNTPPSKSCP